MAVSSVCSDGSKEPCGGLGWQADSGGALWNATESRLDRTGTPYRVTSVVSFGGRPATVSSALEFRVLGPFEVLRDGRSVGPSGVKRRGLLAVLVLRANQVVSTAELIAALWGDDPPASATNLVQTYVSAWRRVLDSERHGRGVGTRVATLGSGYRLRIDAGELDSDRFDKAVAEAHTASVTGNHRAAATQLGGALRLWRGAPLADLAGVPFHDWAADALEEMRLHAVEEWAVAALHCGLGSDVIPVLVEARERYPLRERLSELLMWAMLQDGRQAEALAAYQDVRRRLAEELGADPGSGLQEMHTRVLQHDPELAAPTRPASNHRLPVPTDSFLGRERELLEVRKLLDEHRLVTLTGPGGAGKTRLAIEVASDLAARRTECGIVLIDASPLTAATLIPDRLAGALGVRCTPGQSVSDALAHDVGTQQLLIVLDNLEHLSAAAPTVAELLWLGPDVRVLATSRTPLYARGEQVYPVPPLAVTDPVPGSVRSAAVALFADRAAAADPAFEVSPATLTAVTEICRRLDGLPLAIELAASRIRVLPPQALLVRLDRRLDLLGVASGDRPHRHQTLRATIDWSYQLLNPPTRQTFRAFAVFRGGWSIPAAV